jgi:hypothetical protein
MHLRRMGERAIGTVRIACGLIQQSEKMRHCSPDPDSHLSIGRGPTPLGEDIIFGSASPCQGADHAEAFRRGSRFTDGVATR